MTAAAVADRRLIQSARDFADSLDRETAGTFRSLAALAQSERLERGDLAAFHAEATRVLAAAPDFAPDVIVCDIGLPDTDGYDLCRHHRRLPACRSSRLIALTGYGQSDDIARATAAGFDLHLTKPVDVPTLRSAVSATVPA